MFDSERPPLRGYLTNAGTMLQATRLVGGWIFTTPATGARIVRSPRELLDLVAESLDLRAEDVEDALVRARLDADTHVEHEVKRRLEERLARLREPRDPEWRSDHG